MEQSQKDPSELWIARSHKLAHQFLLNVETHFKNKLREAAGQTPGKDEIEEKLMITNIFMDYLVDSIVIIGSQYIADPLRLRDILLQQIPMKFDRLMKARAEIDSGKPPEAV